MDTIDVKGLTDEEAKLIKELVNLLVSQKTKPKKTRTDIREQEKVQFGEWPLGVKGKLDREEIYDYL